MFGKVLQRSPEIKFCPVLDHEDAEGRNTIEKAAETEARDETIARGEIFVLAANIYYRARRHTRARAAGIL